MNKGKEYLKKSVLCLCMLLISALSAEAANGSLTGIDVKQNIKDGYNVILKLAGNAGVKKTISASDTLTLILSSTLPSDTMEIIYDNTSDVNNVIVQKKNADNTIIILEGKNIANANIFTKDISTGVMAPVGTETLFFGVNKKMLSFSIGAMFLCFLLMPFFKSRRNRRNELTQNRVKNAGIKRTAPSIAYKTVKGYVSAPKDFVINRYMEGEKIKKAC